MLLGGELEVGWLLGGGGLVVGEGGAGWEG